MGIKAFFKKAFGDMKESEYHNIPFLYQNANKTLTFVCYNKSIKAKLHPREDKNVQDLSR